MSYRRAVDFQDTNGKIVQDMISYVENISRRDLPYEAVIWIIGILKRLRPLNDLNKYVIDGRSNEMSEVTYSFLGETREKNKWKIEFVINVDVENKARKQYASFGSDNYVMKKTFCSTDERFRNDKLQFGRSETRNTRSFEQFPTEHKGKYFRRGNYASWDLASSKDL